MTAGFIFILHAMLLVYAFILYKKESIGEGFLAIAFICIIFAVGWTIATMMTNVLFAISWFEKWYWQPVDSWIWQIIRKEISRDTISLLLLTFGEAFFYYFFFFSSLRGNQEKNTPTNDSNTPLPQEKQ